MIIAIVGSRNITVPNLGDFLPEGVTEIVSGGARGVDSCAGEYAKNEGIPLTEFLPEYDKYGKSAPIVRNRRIVSYADEIIAFWDGSSRGTKYVLNLCKKEGKKARVFLKTESGFIPLEPEEPWLSYHGSLFGENTAATKEKIPSE